MPFVKHELPGLAHDEVKAAREGKYDPGWMMYSYSFFSEMQKAIEEDGVNVMGCVAWSATNEWEMGYSKHFGVIRNDFLFDVDPGAPCSTRTRVKSLASAAWRDLLRR